MVSEPDVSRLASALVGRAGEAILEERTQSCEPIEDSLLQWLPGELDTVSNFSGISLDLVRGGQRRRAPSPSEAQAALSQGWTVQLQNVERYSPSLTDFCARLSSKWAHAPVRINAYITPSQRDSAFHVHHDVLHALILQVRGQKRWRVWDPTVANPVWVMARELHHNPPASETPKLDLTLNAGDVLFVRRGDPHLVTPISDESRDQASVHLTIGIHPPTAHDLIRHVADEMSRHKQFRSEQPLTGVYEDEIAWIEEVRRSAAAWWDAVSAESLHSLLARIRAVRDMPRPGILAQGAHVERAKPDATWTVVNPMIVAAYDPKEASLHVNGRSIWPVEASHARAVAKAIKDRPKGFSVIDIAPSTDGDFEELSTLLAKLAELGVIRLVSEGART